MANKEKTKELAADNTGANEETAVAVKQPSDILALSDDGGAEFKQIISENFGGNALTLADLDKVKIPSGGAVRWEIPTIVEGDDGSTKELVGIIIGWADKKSWWQRSYTDSSKEDSKAPDCKSNDMVYGIGNPTAMLNDKEKQLVAQGKANEAPKYVDVPDTDQKGWLCGTCPHNIFGSAAQGGGKSCQDKRFLLFLMKDKVLPVLIRVPATSITPIKEYFKRLAGSRTSYLGVLTNFSLIKIEAAKDYSRIVPKAVRKLTPEELAQVRTFREPFQMALDADDAVEQGYTEKDVTAESLDDMPTHSGSDQPEETGTSKPEGDDPF